MITLAPLPGFLLEKIQSGAGRAPVEVLSFDGEIPQGRRNRELFERGAALRERGWTVRQLSKELRRINAERCNPPLPEAEVRAIVDSIDRYPRGQSVLEEFGGQPAKPIEYAPAISAAALAAMPIDAPIPIVEQLIYPGLTILASPPKFGKSWFALFLGLSITLGRKFLGFETTQAGVLYLALEDGLPRLQDRMRALLHVLSAPAPEELHLRIDAPTIRGGLLGLLAQHLDAHPGCKLIVIDTLETVRDGAKNMKEGAYSADYRELRELKGFADQRGVCVLLIHHLRKLGDDGDVMARISGTTGVTGAADTLLVLSRKVRTDQDTTLSITGRDVEAGEFKITFDKPSKAWRMLGNAEDVQAQEAARAYDQDPVVVVLRELLAAEGSWEGTTAELAREIADRQGVVLDLGQLGKRLRALAPDLAERDFILHEAVVERTKRTHRIYRSAL